MIQMPQHNITIILLFILGCAVGAIANNYTLLLCVIIILLAMIMEVLKS